jgi:hypothetical protein
MHMLIGGLVLGADATEAVSADRFALARPLVEQQSIDEIESRTSGAQLYVGGL